MFKLNAQALTNCSIPFLLGLFFFLLLTGCSTIDSTVEFMDRSKNGVPLPASSFKPMNIGNSGVPLGAVSRPFLIGLIYKNVRLPLTMDLNNTPMTDKEPTDSEMVEIRAPMTGPIQVNGNAIGAIAKQNGIEELYFADQHHFSILGLWTTRKTIVYGK
jgi:hypothetical protein